MIVTIKHKENDEWHDVDLEFPTVDHAKRHAVKEGYAEYKVWQHGDLQCHLFNAVAKAEPMYHKAQKKTKEKQKLTVLANLVSKEEEAEEDNE
jgi:hypothetical protein